MNEIIRRLNDAHTEWSKHLDINGSPSFGVWLLNRAESAEARADLYAETIETLVNEKAQAEKSFNDALADLKAMMQERDELRRQLEQACNEVTDDVTRLEWLKSLIHESQKHIEVLSEGDLDAGYTCLREVQDLHDALKAMINGGES